MEKAQTVYLSQQIIVQDQAKPKADVLHDIFDQYYGRIYNFMRYRINNIDEAEELTSQVFELVFNKLNTFNADRAPFEVWLFTIARNVVNDHYRRQKRWQWLPLDSLHNVGIEEPNPEENVVKNEEQSRLIDALASLNERERNLIALKFAGGLKNHEIAKLTGLSESNVGVLLYRSLHRLREIMDNQEVRKDERQ